MINSLLGTLSIVHLRLQNEDFDVLISRLMTIASRGY